MNLTGNEFRLTSGATLLVSVACWQDIKALHDAVLRELRGTDVSGLDVVAIQKAGAALAARLSGKKVEPGDMDGAAEGFNHMADRAMSLLSSREVSGCIFKCAEKAVYRLDGSVESSIPVTPALFDNPKTMEQARCDFYEIAYHVSEVNLRPFVSALSSALGVRREKSNGTPLSNATSTEQNSSPSDLPVKVTAGVTRSAS